MKTQAEIDAEAEAAELRVQRAQEELRRAQHDQRMANLSAAGQRAADYLAQNPDIPPFDLGERIADAARDHGSECGRLGQAETTPSWKRFRVLLAELVRRAGKYT
jgi:hypothetical protein